MSTPSHASASLRPVLLPPALQPFAIAAMAPPTARGLSAGIAFGCYALLVGAAFAAGRLKVLPRPPYVTPPSVTVQLDPPGTKLHSAPPKVERLARSGGGAGTRPMDAPVTRENLVPAETPASSPTTGQTGLEAFDPSLPIGPGTRPGPESSLGTSHPGDGDGSGVVEMTTAQVRILSQVQPVYPSPARAARIQGPVVLRMSIDTQGVPTEVQVASGHPALQAEAMRAARLWRFAPALVNGHAAPATFQLTIIFSLR